MPIYANATLFCMPYFANVIPSQQGVIHVKLNFMILVFLSLLALLIPQGASASAIQPGPMSASVQQMIASVNNANPVNVKTLGASGSAQTTTGSIYAGSKILRLSAPIDFKNGQGIEIADAGQLPRITAPRTLSIKPTGAPGSTNYTYAVAALDGNGGITVAVTASISTGNSRLSRTNNNQLSVGNVPNAKAYLWWRIASGGTPSTTGFLAMTYGTHYRDQGHAISTPPFGFPGAPPSRPVGGPLITKITGGAGSSKLILADTARSTVTSATIIHDDSAALQKAFDLGGPIYLPPGTYNIAKSLVIPNSNTDIFGAGIYKTIVSNNITRPNDFYSYGTSANPWTITSINSTKLTRVFIHDITFNGNYYPEKFSDGVSLSNVDSSLIYDSKTINSVGSDLSVTSMQFSTNGGIIYNHYSGLKGVVDSLAYHDSGEIFSSSYSTNSILAGNSSNNQFLFTVGGRYAWTSALNGEGSTGITIVDNDIQGVPTGTGQFPNSKVDAADLVEAYDATVSNNTFSYSSLATSLYHSSILFFTSDNPFINSGNANANVNILIKDNKFTNGGTAQFIINNGWAGDIQVINNDFQETNLNIQSGGTDSYVRDVSIRHNHFTIDHIHKGAISIGDVAGNSSKSNSITITDNQINDSSGGWADSGISVQYASNTSITDNTIYSPGQFGISISNLSHFVVDRNKITGGVNHKTPYSIAIFDEHHDRTGIISDNVVNSSNVIQTGLSINNPTNLEVLNNIFINGGDGIYNGGKGGLNVQIENNDLTNNVHPALLSNTIENLTALNNSPINLH